MIVLGTPETFDEVRQPGRADDEDVGNKVTVASGNGVGVEVVEVDGAVLSHIEEVELGATVDLVVDVAREPAVEPAVDGVVFVCVTPPREECVRTAEARCADVIGGLRPGELGRALVLEAEGAPVREPLAVW